MPPEREIQFEGLTDAEILSLPSRELEELILMGEPLIFRAASATILGSFRKVPGRLIIELAQIEGGGEGVLISLSSLARRYAGLNSLTEIDWIVHAVSCAKPNLKLKRVLDRRGFTIEHVPGVGDAYHLVERV